MTSDFEISYTIPDNLLQLNRGTANCAVYGEVGKQTVAYLGSPKVEDLGGGKLSPPLVGHVLVQQENTNISIKGPRPIGCLHARAIMKHVVYAGGLYKCSPGVSGSRNLTDCSAVKGICFL